MAKPTDRVMMAGFIFIMVVESEFRVSGFRVNSKQDSARLCVPVCTHDFLCKYIGSNYARYFHFHISHIHHSANRRSSW